MRRHDQTSNLDAVEVPFTTEVKRLRHEYLRKTTIMYCPTHAAFDRDQQIGLPLSATQK